MSYRSIYEKMINQKIPKGYEIHHIDMNRNNNQFANLVMLPKKLHQNYHRTLEHLKYQEHIEVKIKSVLENGNGINSNYLRALEDFVNVWEECSKWNDYKYYLIGMIPNIHNIEVKSNGSV